MHDWRPLHEFWFGKIEDTPAYAEGRFPLWWRKDSVLDAKCRDEFAPLLGVFDAGELEPWKEEPTGWATLVVLLDQIPRNSFRGTPKSFQWDPHALNQALELIETGTDRKLHPYERSFAYLPLEHSESLDLQKLSVEMFTRLAAEHPNFEEMKDYAHRHYDVIAKYGRFPHRNSILKRESTPEEKAYLAQPGAGF